MKAKMWCLVNKRTNKITVVDCAVGFETKRVLKALVDGAMEHDMEIRKVEFETVTK